MSYRVIEDSDDDDDESIVSVHPVEEAVAMRAPEMNETSPATTTSASVQHATSSTDPVLFQTVYNEIFAARNSPAAAVHGSQDFPSLTQLISDTVAPRMTSSPEASNKSQDYQDNALSSVMSTANINGKVKRTQSLRETDGNSQITTPYMAESSAENDSWAFPFSSPPHGNNAMKQFRSRNAKTMYGMTSRRSKTMIETISKTSTGLNENVQSKDELSPNKGYNQIKRSQRGKKDPSSRMGKQYGMSVNALINKATTRPSKAPDCNSEYIVDYMPNSAEQASIQVARSTSTEPSGESIIRSSEPITLFQMNKRHDTHEEMPASPDIERAVVSVIIHPSSLTDSQRQQYQPFHEPSPELHAASSLSNSNAIEAPIEMPASSLVTTQDLSEQGSVGVSVHHEPPLSSPPIAACGQKLKRAWSELQGVPHFNTPIHHPKGKSLKRSETMEPINKFSLSQGSEDELSLKPIENSVAENLLDKTRRGKHPRQADERVSIDELLGSDDAGLPRERYLPRSRRRQSRGTMASDREQAEFAEPRSKRVKSAKDAIESSISIDVEPAPLFDEPATRNVNADGSSETTLILTDELFPSTVDLSLAMAGNANVLVEGIQSSGIPADTILEPDLGKQDDDEVEKVPQPAPRKKRGQQSARRKAAPTLGNPHVVDKTVDIQHEISLLVTEVTNFKTPGLRGKENAIGDTTILGSHKLSTSAETSTNAPGSSISQVPEPIGTPLRSKKADCIQPTHNTPSEVADTDMAVAANLKTPSKPFKAPDHHSPLHSGKVPYRVGLSKRNKIAPLLKVIRK